MNTTSVGQNNLRFLYYRYKDSPYYSLAVIVIVFAVALILFFLIIIPQVESWFSIRNEVIAARNRINTINDNISFINTIDKSNLDTQVTVAKSALPTEKDFGSMITVLSESALNSGVSLDDFNFQIGNTSSSSGKLTNTNQKDLSTIKLTIIVTGTVDNVGLFLKNISEKLPLSEIDEVDGEGSLTTIKLHFYHKQFPNIVYKDDEPILQLSIAQQKLLQTLSSWRSEASQGQQDNSLPEKDVPLF